MKKTLTFSQTYKPTHDEAARQGFVGALKGYLNRRLEEKLGGYFGTGDHQGLLTGLRYFGTVELYRAVKGLAAADTTGDESA